MLTHDFFRLIANPPSKEDDVEAYERVSNIAFRLMNCVHTKVVATRTVQNQDAMILFQMAISKCLAISMLMEGVKYRNRLTGGTATILDPTPVGALVRTQFEAFSAFHNIYNSSSDQNVVDFMYDIWVIAGLNERQRGGVGNNPERQQKAEKEKEQIDQLITRVQLNSVFVSQTEAKQRQILEWISKRKFEMVYRNGTINLSHHRDMFLNSGVNDSFSNQYAVLSWFTHPSYVSVLQFGQMFEKNFNEEHAYTFLHVSRFIISMLIVEYCIYFPEAMEEFGNLERIDQLIVYFDNRTYRSQSEFTTEVFEDLENEIQEMMKNKQPTK
jgi:hypothetical protein